jgi:hypothetical protein
MPNSVIKSFAKKSGKSEAEVEKMWDSVKASLIKGGASESDENFYPKLTGIVKKNLKLESIIGLEEEFYTSFIIERARKKLKKEEEPQKKPAKKAEPPAAAPSKYTDPQGDEYEAVAMLRAIIEVIRDTDDPDGNAGEGGELDYGLEIMYEVADQLEEETVETIIDALFQFYDVDEDEVEDQFDDDDDDEKDEGLYESLMIGEDNMDEAPGLIRQKRLRQLKAKRKRQLGKRSGSMQFKRNYRFDSKKKRFVKRNKPVSVAAMRKKARTFKRVNRRGSTKAKAKKTKRRLKNVKDPYRSSNKR